MLESDFSSVSRPDKSLFGCLRRMYVEEESQMNCSVRISVTFNDGVTERNLLVSPLGENRYLLEEAPLSAESVFYKDVFEAEQKEDGSLLFQKIVERSGMQNYDYLLPRSIFESDRFERLLERIDEAGGHWTQAFDGVFLVACLKKQT